MFKKGDKIFTSIQKGVRVEKHPVVYIAPEFNREGYSRVAHSKYIHMIVPNKSLGVRA